MTLFKAAAYQWFLRFLKRNIFCQETCKHPTVKHTYIGTFYRALKHCQHFILCKQSAMPQMTCKICTCKSAEACTNVLVMWIVLLASSEFPADWECQRMMPESVKSSNCVCNGGDNSNIMATWSSHPLEKETPQRETVQRNGRGLIFTEKEQGIEKE